MAGTLLTILPPTLFDFTNIILVGNSVVNVPIALRVDLSQYESAVLQVRVHGNLAVTNPDTIDVLVSSDGYTPDDPGIDFSANGLGTQLAVLQIQATSTAPDLLATNIAGFGGIVKVSVRGNRQQGGVSALTAKLSIDIAAKTAAATAALMARRPGTFMGYMPDLSTAR